MRLNQSSRVVILGNIHLLNFCKQEKINMEKLKTCNIEKMGNDYLFVMNKEGIEKYKGKGLEYDIATQPDIVLKMKVAGNNITFETTDKTYRIKE